MSIWPLDLIHQRTWYLIYVKPYQVSCHVDDGRLKKKKKKNGFLINQKRSTNQSTDAFKITQHLKDEEERAAAVFNDSANGLAVFLSSDFMSEGILETVCNTRLYTWKSYVFFGMLHKVSKKKVKATRY